MIEREGVLCRWCGYPIDVEDEWLCATCREWCAAVGDSHGAIGYAARENEKERQQRWEKNR